MKTATIPTVSEEQWKELYKGSLKDVAEELGIFVEELEAKVSERVEDNTWYQRYLWLGVIADEKEE